MLVKENFRPIEAAQFLGIGLSSLWLLIKKGELTTVKLGARTTIIEKAQLSAFIERKRGGAK